MMTHKKEGRLARACECDAHSGRPGPMTEVAKLDVGRYCV